LKGNILAPAGLLGELIMAAGTGPNWDAISAIVTAIGVLTALALGVWANWLQYRQARQKERQEKVLLKAWSSALCTDFANSLVRAKKLRAKLPSSDGDTSFSELLTFCKEARLIDASYIDSFVSQLHVFPVSVSQSIAVFHTEIRRLRFIADRIESGENIHLPEGGGAVPVLKRSLDTVIGWGELAMDGLYVVSEIPRPPDLDAVARKSLELDKKWDGRF
jgi:hypothetical protein